MGNPSRLGQNAPPAATAKEPKAPPAGAGIVRSQRTGDPLPEASADSPGHSPIAPFAPVDNGRKPFKLKG